MDGRQSSRNPLAALIVLGQQVRRAQSEAELGYLLVNASHTLAPYRQAALWNAGKGVTCLSGVLQVEANVPFVQWLNKVCTSLQQGEATACRVDVSSLPEALRNEWGQWLPANGLWLKLPTGESTRAQEPAVGGLLLARELPWSDHELALLSEWLDIWHFAWANRHAVRRWPWQANRVSNRAVNQSWWQRRVWRWGFGLLLCGLIPVRLSVLAPGELVPAHPAVIRASLEGVIEIFDVQPNQLVREGEPLFAYDQALIKARHEVARQALATAETEYRQALQQALIDPKFKAQLAVLTGKIEEKRTEVIFTAEQVGRARVLAPRDGIALFDDPGEWIGKPVTVGERIMRIATPGDIEVEAWVPLADAIPLGEDADISLYLNASPLEPVQARLRYLAHDAVLRPDGNYAYRLRATLNGSTGHRVGLKGTAKLRGSWVPLAWWMLRRPLASIRTTIGW
jgi:hypothetical protein